MNLKSFFEKPVDRHIEGVIKADDEAGLRTEVEEYILTDEVSKQLAHFLDAYNDYQGANGAWISGFFGSGKSHLLKMLALLLENRTIDGIPAVDLFKPKITRDAFLSAQLDLAVSRNAKSILFNIDQKADIISKTQIDALLSVFVKVFDEMSGYFGKQGHVAQFERDLDKRDLYSPFKEAYRDISGLDWSFGREQEILEAANIADAYARVTGCPPGDAANIMDKYRKHYKVSIEDFSEMVKQFVDSRGEDFRLNFFVDEVGQYIADNVKLMTNLQTIAESLATRCSGRAWIIVTAQEDMDSVVGDMGHMKGNDFSKIQARFANRMKLTSKDVETVITERLLKKNVFGIETLSSVYHQQADNFKTLFDFADGSRTYRNYSGRDHFIQTFPFIPYQFMMFQAAIKELSRHNAFEGRHSSVGERSMLGVFQQVTVRLAQENHPHIPLATFDCMFEGIRGTLKSQIQSAVLQAEKNIDNPMAIRILKAMFLVKYLDGFKASVRNICILMQDRFDLDLPARELDIKNALNLLESQTYLQRNGGLYQYLTDEEKDIEQDIKNTEIDDDEVTGELLKMVFEEIIKSSKIRCPETRQDYPFTRSLDGRLLGREYELRIRTVSPLMAADYEKERQSAHLSSADELLVLMEPDSSLVSDLLMYKKTEKYVRQSRNISQPESIRRILSDREAQGIERRREILDRVHSLVGSARLFVKGHEIEPPQEDPLSRITHAFSHLLKAVYPNRAMLRSLFFTEEDIKRCLEPASLLDTDSPTREAEEEVTAFIRSEKKKGMRASLKNLLEHFERKPYGWHRTAILCVLARQIARSNIEVLLHTDILEDHRLEPALKNSKGYPDVLLEPREAFSRHQVRRLKEIYEDLFDRPAAANDDKRLGMETADAFHRFLADLDRLQEEARTYPFGSRFSDAVDRLRQHSERPYSYYLTQFTEAAEEISDLKENLLTPVRTFITGDNCKKFREAMQFLDRQRANAVYIEGDEFNRIEAILQDPECFKGHKSRELKRLMEGFTQKVALQMQQEKDKTAQSVRELQCRMEKTVPFKALKPEQQTQLLWQYDNFLQQADQYDTISTHRDKRRDFEENGYDRILEKMRRLTTPPPQGKEAEPPPDPQSVYFRDIPIEFNSPWLESHRDIEQYLAVLGEALNNELNSGKRIRV
jgi:hypothetical protein